MLIMAIATLLRDLLATLFINEAHDTIKHINTKAANKHRDVIKEAQDRRWKTARWWSGRRSAVYYRQQILDYCKQHNCSPENISDPKLEYSKWYMQHKASEYGVHYDKVDPVPREYNDKTLIFAL